MARQDNTPIANDRITTNLKNGPGIRNRAGRTKVKSGCATCRIRKIKCDENKPACQNCISTGRRCDGYELPFRFFLPTSLSSTSAYAGNFDCNTITQHNIIEITRWDVELLSRHLSTKTIFNVNVGCDREARQLLQASLTDPTIRHALFSLRALRHDLETVGYNQPSLPLDIAATVPLQPLQHTYNHRNGLQHYVKALGGLASSLSSSRQSLASPEFTVLKSVLLCCQIFISIEQLRRNYIAMAQHIIRGLSIMRQYRARPTLAVDVNELLPAAHQDELPLLDVFIIKLYIAPCKFVEPPLPSHALATTSTSTTTAIADGRIIQSTETIVSSNPSPSLNPSSSSSPSQTTHRNDFRSLAPNMRTELTDIGSKVLTFLSQISTLTSTQHAHHLQSAKSALLKSLSLWLIKLNLAHTPPPPPPSSSAPPSHSVLNQLNQEPISVAFLRFFHQILRIIVLGALEEEKWSSSSSSSSSSPDLDIELQQIEIEIENERLLDLAGYVAERVRDYRMPGIK